MSLLPGQILPQSVPLGIVDKNGQLLIDQNWYLFFYNMALQILSRQGAFPSSQADLLDMVDLDAASTDLPQASRQLANQAATEAHDVELPNIDLAQIRRDLVNLFLLYADNLLQDAPIHLNSNQIFGVLPVANGGTNANVAGATAANNIGALAQANNLADVASVVSARTNLGLGTMAIQNANTVAITGGTMDGVTLGGTTRAPANVLSLAVSGSTSFGAYTAGTITQTGYITITDSGGTARRLLVG